jgi:hypothetical protein
MNTELSTIILIDQTTPQYKRIPSSEVLMQWACYPLTKSANNSHVTGMTISISIDGHVEDIMVQKWYHDGNFDPDLGLAIHAINLMSLSYGYDNKEDAIKDFLYDGEDVSGLKEVKVRLELKFTNYKSSDTEEHF